MEDDRAAKTGKQFLIFDLRCRLSLFGIQIGDQKSKIKNR
jgi:hypothetical protein